MHVTFLKDYATILESQLMSSTGTGLLDVGRTVSSTELDLLHDGQIGQLYQLHQEITKHSTRSGESTKTDKR